MESEPKPFTQISQEKNKHTKIEEKPIKTNMNEEIKSTINKVKQSRNISLEQLKLLLEINDDEGVRFICGEAVKVCQKTYGNQVLIRGLIEFTNFCKNDCYYCGIRRSNSQADRYRLTKEQMLDCCASGYELGFRTFVLQGGEDGYFTDDKICDVVRAIKEKYPDCAVTLSIGEKSKESYKRYFDAGADRYLLRHETADEAHYKKLHPEEMSLAHRKQCLWDLKEIGYQVGCGFMVGSPGQTVETLYEDLQFIRELQPHMVGIGPFISQKDTPFADQSVGNDGTDVKIAGNYPSHPSACATPGDNCARNDSSKRAGTRHFVRGECGHAEPFAGQCQGKIQALRQQNLYWQ